MGGMFGGGGYDAPDPQPVQEVKPAPVKQATKPVSAGAQAAAEAQRERSKRNKGLAASILTYRSGLADNGTNPGNDTLG